MPIDMELEAGLATDPISTMAPYPPKVITLANGKKMVVRQAAREDVPANPQVRPPLPVYRPGLLRYRQRPAIWRAARLVSLPGEKRILPMGQVDGYLVGIVNGRLENEKVGMSYHTLAIDRGLRIGSHLFAAKMEYHMEYLGQDEVLIVAESPIGFRRWMIEYPLEPTKIPHELGGGDFVPPDARDLLSSQAAPGGRRPPGAARSDGGGRSRNQVCR